MEIRLYKSFVKKENSTKRPSGTPDVKNVRLKEETSVIAPTFLLSSYDSTFNYLYVPRWDRYYFVTDCTLNIDGLYELSCNCDRLASFKDSIGSYTCFIERCSNAGGVNIMLADNAVSSEENVSDIESSQTALWGTAPTTFCRTMNNNSGITTFVGELYDFDELFNPNVSSGNIADLVEYYACDPSNYVLDIYKLPISQALLPTTSGVLASGWYDGVACDKLSDTKMEGIVTLNMPARKYNDWREYSPAFTKYYLYIPGIGISEIPNNIIDNTLSLRYYLDLLTGDVAFNLLSENNGSQENIGVFSGNLKASVQYGSMTPSVGGIVNSAVGLVASVATENPIAIGASAVNAVQNVISPSPNVSKSLSSFAEFKISGLVHVIRQSKESSESPNTLGQPCNKNLSIGSVPGFIQCAGASVNIPGFESDKEVINNYLNTGFYYE